MQYGIDAVMAPDFHPGEPLREGMRLVEEAYGRRFIQVVTPWLNMDNTPEAYAEAEAVIARCAREGATFCLIHHASAEQLVNKNTGTMDRLPDYLAMIRKYGMLPGLSAHMPELVQYADANNYDVETYIQIYNCMGFLMQVEVEGVNAVIWNAKKPVMSIKSMAAGRCTPFVGLTFSYATLRYGDRGRLYAPGSARGRGDRPGCPGAPPSPSGPAFQPCYDPVAGRQGMTGAPGGQV